MGFIQFSASFTDKSDVITTIYDFKLKNFIMAGYGKNVYISKYDYESFKDNESDFSDEEKKDCIKVVDNSLYVKSMQKRLGKLIKCFIIVL